MAHTTHGARVIGPLHYLASGGVSASIPLGPCLVEQVDGRSVDICWGDIGDQYAKLSFEELEAAEGKGLLVILD